MSQPTKPIVISGCSGGGKSTLIAELARQGFDVAEEPAREVIASGIPVSEVEAFVAAVLLRERERLEWAGQRSGITFFDRSAVEIINFARERRVSVPAPFDTADLSALYHRRVIFAPTWEEIYLTDAERTHDFDAALREAEALQKAYPALGYELAELPRAPVSERAAFVLATLRL